MDIYEAMIILNENRPNQPKKTPSKKFQAAVDTITHYFETNEREIDSTKHASLGIPLDGKKIIFYDGIFNIISETRRAKKLIVCAPYDLEVSLDYFRQKYKAVIVIYEQPLHGIIYRYGNHGNIWEAIGTTMGYA